MYWILHHNIALLLELASSNHAFTSHSEDLLVNQSSNNDAYLGALESSN